MKITFIVPAYNAEKTLGSCISSILSQGLDSNDFEVIIVNDGSTDNTVILGQKYDDAYPNIHLKSQENQGLSVARNVGISFASGEYICFVDSDDCLVPGGIASLLCYCDGKVDLIRFWSRIVHDGTVPSSEGDGRIVFQGTGIAYLQRFGLETFCWNYLYRRAYLEEKQLLFRSGIVGEDFAFMFDVLSTNPSLVSIGRRIYCYVIQPNSISTNRTVAHSRKWVKDLTETMRRISKEVDSFKKNDSELYARCHQSLDGKMVSLFSRVLSADYSIGEYRTFLKTCRDAGLLPLRYSGGSIREKLLFRAVSILSSWTWLYPAACFFYTRGFLPYVYPTLDRNG